MGDISSKRASIAVLLFICLASFGWSQEEKRELIRSGNKLYESGDYTGASQAYSKAGAVEDALEEADYNKANSLYKQNNFEEAAKLYQQIGESSDNPTLKSKAYHNLGNSLVESKKFEPAIDAYKKALRSNPSDEDTRYNLQYAKQMLKEQQKQEQEQKQDQNKDQEEKKDEEKKEDQQNKDDQNKDQEKNDDQKDKNENQDENQNQKPEDQKDKPSKPKPNELSKEDAERLLKAAERNEKNTQKGKKKKGVKVSGKSIEKDW